MDDSTHRQCCTCAEIKPLSEFHRLRRRGLDGRQFKCKACCAAYQAAYNAVHGEARALRRREQFELNRERDLAARRAWMERNPDRVAEVRYRRRARKSSTSAGPVDLESLWTGDCGICGEALNKELRWPDPLSKSIDHIIPLARGGTHTRDNLQWAHLVCNSRKGARQQVAS